MYTVAGFETAPVQFQDRTLKNVHILDILRKLITPRKQACTKVACHLSNHLSRVPMQK